MEEFLTSFRRGVTQGFAADYHRIHLINCGLQSVHYNLGQY